MKRIAFIIALFIGVALASPSAHAQLGPTAQACVAGTCSGYGPPVGACGNITNIYTDLSATPAAQYACKNQVWAAVGSSGGSSAFSALTGGANTSAAMVVGSGATLGASGTGVITASNITATANSTLTSLPNLAVSTASLPNSQANAAALAMVFDDSYAVNGSTRYERSYAGLLRRDVLTLNPGYFQDWSVSGTTMPTIAAAVLANWTPSQTVRSFASVGGGENDYTQCPTATTACIANFSQTASAAIAWAAIPPQYRILGTQFGGTGCTSNNTLSPINTITGNVTGNGISCTNNATQQTFTIPSTNNGFFGLTYYVPTSGGGSFTISSVQNGTTTNFTNPATGTTAFATTGYGGTAPSNNGPQRLQFTITPGVAAAVTITQVGTTANTYVSADYIPSGTLPASTNIVVARNAGAAYDIGGSYSAAMLTVANGLRASGLTTVAPFDYRAALLALPDGGVGTTATATYVASTQANHPRDGAHLVGEQLALTTLLSYGYNVAGIDWSTSTPTQETFDQWRWHSPKGHVTTTWTTYFHDFNLDSSASPTFGICMFTCTGSDAAGIRAGVDSFPGSAGNKGYLGFWGGNGAGLGNVTGFCPAIGYTTFNVLTEGNFIKRACFDFATGNFTTVGSVTAAQVIASGSAPTMAPGAAAGTSPTCTTITGANMAGVITCTTGTSTATGTLATITFNGTLGTAPQGCTVMPRTALTAPTATSIYTTAPSTTTWTIGVAAALTASTAYSWSYACE
jgi:hypothetical protein